MDSLPTKILLATDGSKVAELAAQAAKDIPARTGSELHVVHVGNPFHAGAPWKGNGGRAEGDKRVDGQVATFVKNRESEEERKWVNSAPR